MCDCILSTPISLSVTKFRRLPLIRFNRKVPCEGIPNLYSPNCSNLSNGRSLLFCTRTSRNSGAFGSDDYGFRAELGFKEKGDNQFEFETSRGQTKQSRREREDSRGSLDSEFLEVKRGVVEDQKESGKSKESLEQENLIRVEERDGDGDKELVRESGNVGLKKGRQVVRRSCLLAKQVVSIRSALSLGFVSQLWVDTISVSSNARFV